LESGGGGIVSKKFGKKAARLSSSSSLTRAIPPGISKQELLASIPSTSNFVPLNEDIQLGLFFGFFNLKFIFLGIFSTFLIFSNYQQNFYSASYLQSFG